MIIGYISCRHLDSLAVSHPCKATMESLLSACAHADMHGVRYALQYECPGGLNAMLPWCVLSRALQSTFSEV